jgi:K+-sensing histidine kinase KdpD
MYGFQSYISVPITLADGTIFGALCAIDPRPARLKDPVTVGTFKLFADLIVTNLDVFDRLEASQAILLSERQASELREQFIAVLGHDLRNPLASIAAGARLMTKVKSQEEMFEISGLMHSSIARMSLLIDNVLDFARGRLGGGLTLNRTTAEPIDKTLEQVIAEIRSSHLDATIETYFNVTEPIRYDSQRMSQMFSNLLGNAVAHGSTDRPIKVHATTQNHEFELSVVNAGDPIPDAVLKQLFQPFYRGAVRPSQQGLGLGLFIASEIARAHGGSPPVLSGRNALHIPYANQLNPANTGRRKGGLAALCWSRKRLTDDRNIGLGQTNHDWSSHTNGADGFGLICIHYDQPDDSRTVPNTTTDIAMAQRAESDLTPQDGGLAFRE